MKKSLLIPVLALAALSACTQLSEKDRALLQESHMMAKQALDQSNQAAADAQAARADADKAAASAQAASKKADKIFRQGQDK